MDFLAFDIRCRATIYYSRIRKLRLSAARLALSQLASSTTEQNLLSWCDHRRERDRKCAQGQAIAPFSSGRFSFHILSPVVVKCGGQAG